MKVALSSWNQGKFVNEEMIRKDLYEMSDKQLVLLPDTKIGVPGPNQPAQHDNLRKKKKKKKNNRPKQNNYGNKSRNSRNKRRR